MKKFYPVVALALFCLGANATYAQKKANNVQKYQRSSLHQVLLTTDEPTCSDPNVAKYVDEAWANYPFPSKYNHHEIDFYKAQVGNPKGSVASFIAKYSTGNLPSDVEELKQLKEGLSGKGYVAELEYQCNNLIDNQKLAHKLLIKWFDIKEDGSYSTDLINERACYNQTLTEAIAASSTSSGAAGTALKTAENLLNTTFISFVKMEAYENEPYAALVANVGLTIAKLEAKNPLAIKAAEKAAEVLYASTKDGYSVVSTNMLYRLNWNDSVSAVFYDCFTKDDKIDMKKFYETPFSMEFLGSDRSSATVLFSDDAEKAVKTAAIRNLDKQLVKMANSYDVFKPVAPIISLNPLKADMGTKEGLKGGEKFDVLEAVFDSETQKVVYQKVGTVKVDKKGVWNNEFDPTVDTDDIEIIGTVLSKCKKAQEGMVVRQVKAKK